MQAIHLNGYVIPLKSNIIGFVKKGLNTRDTEVDN